MAPDPKYLLWIDLETTGLDHAMDPILEIACIVTTPDLRQTGDRFEAVIDPGGDWWERTMSDYVREMHTKNGLLQHVRTGKVLTTAAAESQLLAMLDALPADDGDPRPILLAGTGVAAFDRRVIENQMPLLHTFLDYRMIDVGYMRRFLSYVCEVPDEAMPPKADDNHRAMADVEVALEQAGAFQGMFSVIG